jgi:subtilisin family serine protease
MLDQLHALKIDAWMDRTVEHTQYNSDEFNDPNLPGQWYIDSLDMYTLWTHSLGDSNTRVAVIDSGIDISHPDLSDKLIAPYDAFDDDDDPSPNPGEYCWEGAGSAICDEHGTAVAGISVADANDAGIVGLCPDCSLIPIKMLGEGNAALSYDVAAMEHAIANDAAVINNSWGYVLPTEAPEPLVNVIERAQVETRGGKGSVVVFAAGNDNRELIDNELCGISGVICVSAVDSYGRPTAYTNYGADVDVAAPSATVSIAPNESLTTNFGGTSAAAPVVSGLAAWVLSVEPDLTSTDVVDLLVSTSEQSPLITPDENGHHDKYGYGIIHPMNVYETLYPPEIEEPAKGGCNTLAVVSPSVKFYPMILGLLAVFGLVRRR